MKVAATACKSDAHPTSRSQYTATASPAPFASVRYTGLSKRQSRLSKRQVQRVLRTHCTRLLATRAFLLATPVPLPSPLRGSLTPTPFELLRLTHPTCVSGCGVRPCVHHSRPWQATTSVLHPLRPPTPPRFPWMIPFKASLRSADPSDVKLS